ncbi:hypothetical protein IPJ72_02720 [Candidatus Peregrinibacteria bacterium]|nr:MAG: hypothetical protein IPJ72_02720 [Candidatus Peregrinibacteria bacterium]
MSTLRYLVFPVAGLLVYGGYQLAQTGTISNVAPTIQSEGPSELAQLKETINDLLNSPYAFLFDEDILRSCQTFPKLNSYVMGVLNNNKSLHAEIQRMDLGFPVLWTETNGRYLVQINPDFMGPLHSRFPEIRFEVLINGAPFSAAVGQQELCDATLELSLQFSIPTSHASFSSATSVAPLDLQRSFGRQSPCQSR